MQLLTQLSSLAESEGDVGAALKYQRQLLKAAPTREGDDGRLASGDETSVYRDGAVDQCVEELRFQRRAVWHDDEEQLAGRERHRGHLGGGIVQAAQTVDPRVHGVPVEIREAKHALACGVERLLVAHLAGGEDDPRHAAVTPSPRRR